MGGLQKYFTKNTRTKIKDVTVLNLLQHTSGLPRDSKVIIREGNEPMLTALSREDLVRDIELAPLKTSPGSVYEYSNLGYGLLGLVLEEASGKSYLQLIREFVTKPYNLKDTGTALNKNQLVRLATPYTKEDGYKPTSTWNTGMLTPASGLYSTITDLAKLMEVLIAGEQLSHVDLNSNNFAISDARKYGYGMNEQKIKIDGKTFTLAYHSGDMDGFAATFLWVKENKNGLVILTNRGAAWKSEFQGLLIRQLI